MTREFPVPQLFARRRSLNPVRTTDHGLQQYAAGALRLVWGGLTFALALLTVFQAPTYLLWQAAIVATEWGHALALAALAPLWPGWRRSRAGVVGGALGLGAALLALTPLARALGPARALPARLEAAFGAPPRPLARPAPLIAAELVRGVPLPDVAPRTLVYSATPAGPLSLDLYPAQRAAAAPVVVVVHGGSWQGGDSRQLAPLNRYLAARGYAVAAINYRLAPRWPFPAARDDLLAAIAFLKRRAGELGLDPARFVLIGRSAGGQLALLTAYTAGDPAIRGAVSLYGPADMVYGYENPASPLVLDSRGVLEAYLGGTPATAPAAYAAASPIGFVTAATPPTLLIHGARDELVKFAQSERLAARLAEAGRPHLLLALPWATHGADFNLSGPFGQISTYAIEHFLAAVTAPAPRSARR
jgi:acetyl esterase/lipase